MRFAFDAAHVLRPPIPDQAEWLQIGFGTKLSETWPPEDAVRLKQIHSDRVILAQRPWPSSNLPEADALISNQPGFALSVRTADCLPILFADLRTRSIAAVHAGWRGTAAGIAGKTVAAFSREFGSKPEDIWVWLGPGIAQCCFEVGLDVAGQFPGFLAAHPTPGKAYLDLAGANIRQLVDVRVPAGQIVREERCTRCEADLFHSWRRDGLEAGRMTAVIGISRS